MILVDGGAVSQSSGCMNAPDMTLVQSADVTLLELIDRLGLAKYARVFVEQEVTVFIFLTFLVTAYPDCPGREAVKQIQMRQEVVGFGMAVALPGPYANSLHITTDR